MSDGMITFLVVLVMVVAVVVAAMALFKIFMVLLPFVVGAGLFFILNKRK